MSLHNTDEDGEDQLNTQQFFWHAFDTFQSPSVKTDPEIVEKAVFNSDLQRGSIHSALKFNNEIVGTPSNKSYNCLLGSCSEGTPSFATVKLECDEEETKVVLEEFEIGSQGINTSITHCSPKTERINSELALTKTSSNVANEYKKPVFVIYRVLRKPSVHPILDNNINSSILGNTSQKSEFKCGTCSYSSRSKKKVLLHVKEHYNILVALKNKSHTGKKFFDSDKREYTASCRSTCNIHKKSNLCEKYFACGICEYRSTHKSYLIAHMKIHTGDKLFKCDTCEYSTSNKYHLTLHIRTHTGEKPFKCNVCEYRVSNKYYLKVHMRNHTGQNPYKCNICDYSTSYKSHLTVHTRIHTGEKPFECNTCKYRVSSKSQLKAHISTHAEKKPFKCDVCEYSTTYKSHLTLHMRTHTREKPFTCNMCEYRGSEKSSLKRHMRSHTGERPFGCNMCEYRASYKHCLKMHLKTHASENYVKSEKV